MNSEIFICEECGGGVSCINSFRNQKRKKGKTSTRNVMFQKNFENFIDEI